MAANLGEVNRSRKDATGYVEIGYSGILGDSGRQKDRIKGVNDIY